MLIVKTAFTLTIAAFAIIGAEQPVLADTLPVAVNSKALDTEARNLLTRYTKCLDRNDVSPCGALFAEDGSLFYYKGRDAIIARMAKDAAADGVTSRKVGNIFVVQEGPDKASMTSDMTVTHKTQAGAWIDRATYRYLDKLTRVNGVWLLSHRETTPIGFQYNFGGANARASGSANAAKSSDQFEDEARQLIATYRACFELKKPPICVANLFAEDGSLNHTKGRDAIASLVSQETTPDFSSYQLVSDTSFKRTGPNEGSSISETMSYRKGPTADMVWSASDRYFDQFVFIDGKWLFSHREVLPVGR